jgi:hypothetical protein
MIGKDSPDKTKLWIMRPAGNFDDTLPDIQKHRVVARIRIGM